MRDSTPGNCKLLCTLSHPFQAITDAMLFPIITSATSWAMMVCFVLIVLSVPMLDRSYLDCYRSSSHEADGHFQCARRWA